MKRLFLFFVIFPLLLLSCARKELEADFRPIQVRWHLAEGVDEEQADSLMPRKDNCMILLTGRLMTEAPVQASKAGELDYEVTYDRDAENPEILVFDAICANSSILDKSECRWRATCDASLKIVVKFHNGD